MPKIINHTEIRKKVLEEFLILFAEKGYDKVILGDVTVMSRTNLYQYFKNKKEIFEEVVKNINKLGDIYNRGLFVYKFRKEFNVNTQEKIQLIENEMLIEIGKVKADV